MSTSTAQAYDLESYWKDLTDPGKRREFVRLEPTDNTPITTQANGESGWEMSERDVVDISLGGVGMIVNALEARKVRVGEMVRLYVTLCDRPFNLHGRAVHLSRKKGGLIPKYTLGIEFVGDASLQRALGDLVETLHSLNAQTGRRFKDIR